MSFFTEFCVLVYGNFYNVMSSGKIEVFLYGDFHSVVSNGKVVSFLLSSMCLVLQVTGTAPMCCSTLHAFWNWRQTAKTCSP